jgi:hypothetical protein
MKAACNLCSFSIAIYVSCLITKSAYVHLLFFLKPICVSFNWCSIIGLILFSINLANSFLVWPSRDIILYWLQPLLLPFFFHIGIVIAWFQSSGTDCCFHAALNILVAMQFLFRPHHLATLLVCYLFQGALVYWGFSSNNFNICLYEFRFSFV